MVLSKMALRSRNTVPDRESLLTTKQAQRSEFTLKERREPKLLKRLSLPFLKQRRTKHHSLQQEVDEATPPSSPFGSDEPLKVSMITSPYPHPLEEDFSSSGATVAGLSNGTKPSPSPPTNSIYSPPVLEHMLEENQVSEESKGMSMDNVASRHSGCSINTSCETVLEKVFGVVDQSCGTGVNSKSFQCASRENTSRSVGHAWGTAPSGVDDDDDDGDFVSRLEPVTAETVSSSSLTTDSKSNTTNTRPTSQLSKPPDLEENHEHVSSPPSPPHESFELVLDPAVLNKNNGKRSILKWRRNDSSKALSKGEIHPKVVNNVSHNASAHLSSHKGDPSVKTETVVSNSPLSVDLSASGKPPLNPASPKISPILISSLRMRSRSKGAQELADDLMENGELLGMEFLDENEESTVQSTSTPAAIVKSTSEVPMDLEDKLDNPLTTVQHEFAPVGISNRTTSWNDLTKALATMEAGNGQMVGGSPINRSTSSPIRLVSDSAKPSADPPKATSASQWRSAIDPISGRPYYYHRINRKSTWTKPRNFDFYKKREKELKLGSSVRPDVGRASEFVSQNLSSVPTSITAIVQEKVESPKASEDSDIPLGVNGQPILQKTNPRDFQNDVWQTKKEITKLLTKMAPPDDESVLKLLAQYEGREDELLTQLGELVTSQPFDEPGELPADDLVHGSMDISGNSMTFRSRTANTTMTSRTEKTDRIKNTSKSSSKFEAIRESSHDGLDQRADGGTLPESDLKKANGERVTPKSLRTQRAIEAKQRASGRTRHLRVEEFSTKRWGLAAVNYEGKASPKQKPPKVQVEDVPENIVEPTFFGPPCAIAMADSSENESNYLGDNDETDVETFTDTISALSVPDPDFSFRMEEFDRIRRQALDDAIQRKDWDLAAAVSDNLRNRSMDSIAIEGAHSEWTQSELDQFISENDWDAVASYIAQMRDGTNNIALQNSPADEHRGTFQMAEKSVSFDAKVQKRFGAKSQLQRVMTEDEHSRSSWESESFYESDSGSSSSTSEELRRRQIRKEFVC